MGLTLTAEEVRAEATPSQRKSIARVTGHGELPIIAAELWMRGMLWVMVGSNPKVARQFTISPRGKVEEL